MFSSVLPGVSSSMKFGQNGQSKSSNRFIRAFKAPTSAPIYPVNSKFVEHGYRSAQPEPPMNWYAATNVINAAYAPHPLPPVMAPPPPPPPPPPSRPNYSFYQSTAATDTYIYEQSACSKSDLFSNSEYDNLSMATLSPSSVFSPAFSNDSTIALNEHPINPPTQSQIPRSATPGVRSNLNPAAAGKASSTLSASSMSRTPSMRPDSHPAPLQSSSILNRSTTPMPMRSAPSSQMPVSMAPHMSMASQMPMSRPLMTNPNIPQGPVFPPPGYSYAESTYSEIEVEERDKLAKYNAEFNATASALGATAFYHTSTSSSSSSSSSSPKSKSKSHPASGSTGGSPKNSSSQRPSSSSRASEGYASVSVAFPSNGYDNSPPSVERVSSQLPPEDISPISSGQGMSPTSPFRTVPLPSSGMAMDSGCGSDKNSSFIGGKAGSSHRTSPRQGQQQHPTGERDRERDRDSRDRERDSRELREARDRDREYERERTYSNAPPPPPELTRQRSTKNDRRSSVSFAGGASSNVNKGPTLNAINPPIITPALSTSTPASLNSSFTNSVNNASSTSTSTYRRHGAESPELRDRDRDRDRERDLRERERERDRDRDYISPRVDSTAFVTSSSYPSANASSHSGYPNIAPSYPAGASSYPTGGSTHPAGASSYSTSTHNPTTSASASTNASAAISPGAGLSGSVYSSRGGVAGPAAGAQSSSLFPRDSIPVPANGNIDGALGMSAATYPEAAEWGATSTQPRGGGAAPSGFTAGSSSGRDRDRERDVRRQSTSYIYGPPIASTLPTSGTGSSLIDPPSRDKPSESAYGIYKAAPLTSSPKEMRSLPDSEPPTTAYSGYNSSAQSQTQTQVQDGERGSGRARTTSFSQSNRQGQSSRRDRDYAGNEWDSRDRDREREREKDRERERDIDRDGRRGTDYGSDRERDRDRGATHYGSGRERERERERERDRALDRDGDRGHGITSERPLPKASGGLQRTPSSCGQPSSVNSSYKATPTAFAPPNDKEISVPFPGRAATVQTASSTTSSKSNESRKVPPGPGIFDDRRTSYFEPVPPAPLPLPPREPVHRQVDGNYLYDTSNVWPETTVDRYESVFSSGSSSSSTGSAPPKAGSTSKPPGAPVTPFPEPQRRYSDGDQNPPPQRPTLTGRNSAPPNRSVRWNENLVAPSPVLASQRRKGFFNRRGDQLWTNDGAYKPAPTGHEYPPDLDEYPDIGEGWMNEECVRIDMSHRLVPKTPLRSALKTCVTKA